MARDYITLPNLARFKGKLDDKFVVQVPGKGLSTEDYTTSDKAKLDSVSAIGSAAEKEVGTGAGNIPVLDGGGKLDPSILPSTSVQEKYAAADADDMIGGTYTTSPSNGTDPDVGDICILPDGTVYMLINDPYTDLSNWILLTTPGTNLTTTNVPEGTNLYYTEARVNTVIAATASTALSDGSTILHTTDITPVTDADIDALFP